MTWWHVVDVRDGQVVKSGGNEDREEALGEWVDEGEGE